MLKTRLDGRSEDNSSFTVLDKEGNVLVEVTLLGNSSSTLEINTKEDLHIEKPNGWTSNR